MNSILDVMKSRKGSRALEITLLVILLLLVFSVGGVPMILLSTVPPPWMRDELTEQRDDAYGFEALNAQVAMVVTDPG